MRNVRVLLLTVVMASVLVVTGTLIWTNLTLANAAPNKLYEPMTGEEEMTEEVTAPVTTSEETTSETLPEEEESGVEEEAVPESKEPRVTDVKVMELTPWKASEPFSAKNFTVYLQYEDGHEEMTEEATISNLEKYDEDMGNILVEYGGETWRVAVPYVSIKNATPYLSKNLIPHAGETVDVTRAHVIYSDGTEETVEWNNIQAEPVTLVEGENEITYRVYGKEFHTVLNALPVEGLVAYHGSERTSIETTVHDEHGGHYFVTHIRVASPEQVIAGLPYDTVGNHRETPRSFAERHPEVALVTNGSYFSYESGWPVNEGVIVQDGKILGGTPETTGQEVCLRVDGTLFSAVPGIPASELIAQGVKATYITKNPTMVKDGMAQSLDGAISPQSYPRTAFGMVSPCDYYIVTEGTTDYHGGLVLSELQNIFVELGCEYARQVDEGGSTQLVIDGKLLNPTANNDERPIADFFVITE